MENKVLKQITSEIEKVFSENLLSILVYGSILHGNKNSDLDLLVILHEKKDSNADMAHLAKIVANISNENLDLQLFYNEEIINPRTFSLDAHGSFFIDVLKQAKSLYGENPFLNIELPNEDRQISALNKVQNYLFRVRQEAIGLGRHSKDTNPLYHRKKIVRVIDDVMIFDGNTENRENTLAKFKEIYPEVLSEDDYDVLEKDSAYSLTKYVGIYEKLYSFLLRKSQLHIPPINVKPKRVRIGDILSEYIYVEGSEKAIIVLEGLPNLPDEKRVLNILANQGYSVFYPRYKGTWESEGRFLEKSPVEDIEELIDALINGIELKEGRAKFTSVSIIASSFGGAVAISLSDREEIDRIVALSPVYDFTSIESLSTLSSFIKKMFNGAYRFEEDDWEKLLNGDLISPQNSLAQFDSKEKIIIFAGENDKEILHSELENFSNINSIQYHLVPGVGHLTYSKLIGNLLEKVVKVI